MMISAYCGHDLMMKAYKEAIKEKYRFYSYGDACLLTRAGVGRTEETGTENAGEI